MPLVHSFLHPPIYVNKWKCEVHNIHARKPTHQEVFIGVDAMLRDLFLANKKSLKVHFLVSN
jgi:hypothetical protein